MLKRVVSVLLCVLLSLPVVTLTVRGDAKNSTAKKREKADLGTRDFSGESQFTGDVAFSIPLVNKGGVSVSLRYNSNVHKLVPADNRFSPPGWVGLGWSIALGSIQADINNTKDKNDDKYFFAGPDAISELIVDTLDSFIMREYRHWKITREVSNGTVVGWTVIIEDGTKLRYGNYDKAIGQFSLDSLPTQATRSLVASGDLIQTTLAPSGAASLVPYQWDLSDIEDVNGDHTTVKYQQINQSLDGTTLLATSESHPKEIIERNGRKVEFVLFDNPLLYYDSPLVGVGQVRRETRSLKRILTKDKQGAIVSGVEFEYDSMNVLNRTSQHNKKLFLKTLFDLDGSLNIVKTTSFEYAGVEAALDTGDHNPGAITRITLPEGGTITYKYCKQVVIPDRSPGVASGGSLWSSYGKGRLATDFEHWSMSGSDFFVVWRSGYLTAYRWFPENRYDIDGTFPLNAVTKSATSAYWVQNDYVVCKYGTSLVVAKRWGDTWTKGTLDSTASAGDLEMLGLGNDYFIYATNCSYSGIAPQEGDMKVATFSNTGTWSVQSLGRRWIYIPNRIVCGTRFFASGGTLPVYVYNAATGLWDSTATGVSHASAGVDCLLRISGLSTFDIKKWAGSASGWTFSQVSGPYSQFGASLIPGNNYFLILPNSESGYPVDLHVATNGSTGWRVDHLVPLLDSAVIDRDSRVAVGPDFVVVTWRVGALNLWKVGVVRYENGQWQQGTIIARLTAKPIGAGNFEQLTPVVSGSTIFTEIFEKYSKLQLHSFVLQNEVWDGQELVNLNLVYRDSVLDNPLKPWMQPGANFTVCVLDSTLLEFGDASLFAWKRSFGVNFREVYSDSVLGGMAYPVVCKTVADGTGLTATTALQHSHGSFDDDINTARFNKSTTILPGSTGSIVSYMYNDLGAGDVEMFQSNGYYRYLDGMPYFVRYCDKDGNHISQTTNDWAVTLPGSSDENHIANPVETHSAGTWVAAPGGEIHTVVDDGATLDPNDYAWTSDGYDVLFNVRMAAPEGALVPGSDIVVSVDALSSEVDEYAQFYIVLYEGTGGGLSCVADTFCRASANTGFTTFTLTVPASLANDPSRLYVGVDLLGTTMWIARVKLDYQVRSDRGVYYARLGQSTVNRDGVSVARIDEYNDINGLIKKTTETNSLGSQRVTETKYAYERGSYATMGSSKHMYSQVYSTTTKNGSDDVELKSWTSWGDSDGVWRPREEWQWKGDGSANDLTAPDDPDGSAEAQRISSIALYDTHGNPRQVSDASGTNTAIVYGYDSTMAVASIKNSPASSVFVTVFDDSLLSGWTGAYGTWSLENGTYRQTNPNETNNWTVPRRNTAVSIDDGVLEADVRFDNQGAYRYVAIDKYLDAQNFILFELRKTDSKVAIDATKNGTSNYIEAVMTFSENRWYHLRAEVHGDSAELFVDGKLMLRLVNAAVNLAAGNIGLCTYKTVASFDNVRFFPFGALASSNTFDRRTLVTTSSQDENGVLATTLYDPFNRKTKAVLRSEGSNVLTGEQRYHYSRSVGGTYRRSRPNAVEQVFPPEVTGYSDFSSSVGWTVYGSNLTFGSVYAGECAVRMGSNDGSWKYVSKQAPAGHTLARVDFFPDNSTAGLPHVLAFDGSGYRLCVQYDPSTDRFKVQYNVGSGWQYSSNLALVGTPNAWYTIEIEKTESGEGYAFVFPKGHGRINQAGYMYRVSGFPATWNPAVYSWANADYYYLANHYVGLPDRAVAYFDGLGRGMQQQQQLKVNTVIASATSYDSVGRPYRIYKAFEKDFADTNRHRYDSLYATDANTYYNSMDNGEAHTSGYPYSETMFQPDPLARAWKQAAPGTDWRIGSGHEVQTTYTWNDWGDIPGYSAGTLFKSVTADEDGTDTWSFTDKFGNAVASVVDPSGLNLITRMQYDILGNQTSSITPRADTTKYYYSPLRQVRQKISPDQGTAQYLFDKNGNLRLVKDAAHTGANANSVYLNNDYVMSPYSYSNQFSLNMPGRVDINARVYDIEEPATLHVLIKANGTTLKAVQTSGTSGSNGSIILPKGTYTYEIQASGSYGVFGYTISCQTGFEFVYHKYDAFNRLIETGEYESNSASANFSQANAENPLFPTSNTHRTAVLTYDTESSDGNASGQRNLKGRLSMAQAYRLGTLELTTSYSYNHFGNVEWIVHTNSTGRWWTVTYQYDAQGRVTRKGFLDVNSANYSLYNFYEYDQMGRLTKVSTGPNADGTGKVQEAAYTYYAGGATKRKQLAQVQGVDYRYNTREWLTMINHQNLGGIYEGQPQDPGRDGYDSGLPVDRFGMIIGYNAGSPFQGAMVAPSRFNGNLSWAMYNMHNVLTSGFSLVGGAYAYDNANRLVSSNFGYYDNSWRATRRYDDSVTAYDANGNIQSVRRYGADSLLMDNLSYVYSTGTNRLRHITDQVPAGNYTVDIDNQAADNYVYDDNGSLQTDVQRDIAFVVNDIRNLPVSMWKASTGEEVKYYYDTEGKRIRKGGSATEYYVNGISGETEAVVNSDGSGATHSILGYDNLGQIKRAGTSWNKYYYQKDHLGTIKMTVEGGQVLVADEYSTDLSKWTTVLGSGFGITGGELADSASGTNILINSGSGTIGNGLVTVSVRNVSSANADPSVIVRYQNTSNFYQVHPYNNWIAIYEVLNGTYYQRAVANLPAQIVPGTWYGLKVRLQDSTITAVWNGTDIVSWKDTSPWLSGKVGLTQCNNRNVRWDNFVAHTGNLGAVVGYDDYYPFGMQMDGRCGAGGADSRYKFTGKERDVESQYDYFGARYYDARVGRWLSMDPLGDKYAEWSPYTYALGNPLRCFDPDGKIVRFANGVSEDFKRQFSSAVQYLNKHGASGMLAELHRQKTIYYVAESKLSEGKGSQFDSKTRTISWDPTMGVLTRTLKEVSPTTILNHEVDHALQYEKHPDQYAKDRNEPDAQYKNKEEKRVITGSEQTTAKKLGEISDGELTRTDHRGDPYTTTGPTSTEPANAINVTPKETRKEQK